MKRTFTKLFFKAPLILLPFLFIATGCHTPEDLREIGPQQEGVEVEWNQGDSELPRVSEPDISDSPSDEIDTYNSDLLLIKTPFKPSSRRTRDCRGC